MGAVEEVLTAVRAEGRRSLVGYVVGGVRDDWTDLVAAMADAGADAVEIALPFSDPMLDGAIIQAASAAALANGATARGILQRTARLDAGVPLIAMTYANHMYSRGIGQFCRMLSDGGMAGVIVPDLQLDESEEYRQVAAAVGLDAVMLASPNTAPGRLQQICSATRGFLYSVSVMDTTGGGTPGEPAFAASRRAKTLTDKPVLIGFGVNDPAIAEAAAEHADGVVVASALMRLVLDGAAPRDVARAVTALRDALERAAA